MNSEQYWSVGLVVGGLVFLACWLYAIASWGFLLGVGLGWIPAAAIGFIAAAIWPALLVLVGLVAFLLIRTV